MIRRDIYDLTEEPSGAVLRGLVEWAQSTAAQLGLIVHSPSVRLAPRAVDFLDRASPYLSSEREVAEWPGTRLIGGRRGILRVYRLTPELTQIFEATADRLYMWVNPGLPEDPHLLRDDGSVLLGTVSQEEDAWLELHESEFASLIGDVPWTADALRRRT